MPSILFVCLGNICRSPAAEAVLRTLASSKPDTKIHVASCGIGSWHIGELPDKRMKNAAQLRGYQLASRAQQIKDDDFIQYDYILAADHEVLNDLRTMAKSTEGQAKVCLMTKFGKRYKDEEIPDPYYGGDAGFDTVLDMVEDACKGLLEHI